MVGSVEGVKNPLRVIDSIAAVHLCLALCHVEALGPGLRRGDGEG
jgi:hypothetical protein